MGGYLSRPIKDKESVDFEGNGVVCGASSMQGWRANQEDAHNCIINFDEETCLFAVYDGHGGHEVAEYTSRHLPDFIKNNEDYKKGDYEQALISAFLDFDATLIKPEVKEILKKIAATDKTTSKDGEKCIEDDDNVSAALDEEDEAEELEDLCKEANMPLDELIDRYKKESAGRIKFNSPNIKRTRDMGASTSGASSSGLSYSKTNGGDDGEVSSTSKAGCSSSLTNGEVAINGDIDKIPNGETSEAGSSSDKCNGDINHKDEVDGACSSSIKGKMEVGSSSKVKKEDTSDSSSKNKDDLPDSSSQSQNDDKNVSSSSNVDESESKEDISEGSSSSDLGAMKEAVKKSLRTLTMKLLSSDPDEMDGDEDDDEFDGAEESDDDDDDEEGGEEEEEEDDDEDEDDEEEEDEDEEEPTLLLNHNEEPGYDSGCTAVVAILKGNKLFVANAGDSRCVVCRDGEAVDMSIDHKPEDEIELNRIVAAGGKVSRDGRVNGGLNLSRAIGDHTYKQVSTIPATEQMITALPDVKKLEIDPAKDEFMVLACDGIWNSLNSQEVVDFIKPKLAKNEKKSAICEELFELCLAPNTHCDGTGCDNMTCIIVQFKPNAINGQESMKRPSSLMSDEDAIEADLPSKRQKVKVETTSN